MKRTLSIAVSVPILLLFTAGCRKAETGGDAAKAQKPRPLVKVMPAKLETHVQWLELTGDVVATNAVSIRAIVDGPISFCPWREGDTVEKGAKLIEIDRPVYREEVQGAEAALAVASARLADLKAGARPEEIAQADEAVKQLQESASFAQSDLKRIEQMVKSGSLPGEALEKARVAHVKGTTDLTAAQEKRQMLKAGPTVTAIAVQAALVKEAEARLGKAKAAVAECELSAPFDSVVTRVYVRQGDLATAKSSLVDLIEKDSLVVRFGIPEVQSAMVRKDTPVNLTFDALPGRKFESRVVRVYPEVETGTRTRTVEAAVAPGLGVVPGMFARVAVAVRTLANAVIVPESALVLLPNGDTVAFVLKEEKAVRRNVKTAMEAGGAVAIASGIQAGEMVIVQGNDALKDGAAVKVMGGQKKDGGKPVTASPGAGKTRPAAEKEEPAL